MPPSLASEGVGRFVSFAAEPCDETKAAASCPRRRRPPARTAPPASNGRWALSPRRCPFRGADGLAAPAAIPSARGDSHRRAGAPSLSRCPIVEQGRFLAPAPSSTAGRSAGSRIYLSETISYVVSMSLNQYYIPMQINRCDIIQEKLAKNAIHMYPYYLHVSDEM